MRAPEDLRRTRSSADRQRLGRVGRFPRRQEGVNVGRIEERGASMPALDGDKGAALYVSENGGAISTEQGADLCEGQEAIGQLSHS